MCWTRWWSKVKHIPHSKYTFPFSLTFFGIVSLYFLLTLSRMFHRPHLAQFFVVPTQFVSYALCGAVRQLFCCKVLSDWLLCLKRTVFTAHYELTIYNHGVPNATVQYLLSLWLCNTAWSNEIGSSGDAASQVAALTTCRSWTTRQLRVVWNVYYLSVCFCLMYSLFGCTTILRTPHSECLTL